MFEGRSVTLMSVGTSPTPCVLSTRTSRFRHICEPRNFADRLPIRTLPSPSPCRPSQPQIRGIKPGLAHTFGLRVA